MDSAKIGTGTKKWVVRIVVGILLFGVLGTALYSYATLHFVYSSGERVGFVQKISKKGWVCKTNEGELAMVNVAGQPAEIFAFTVPDEGVVKQIEALAGHRVSIKYEEHVGIPTHCFGDTQYFVVSVKDTQ
jgi:hypothetical protein